MTRNVRERDTTLKQISVTELNNPFNVLVATILSQRNRDERTEVISKQLFQTYKTAHEMAEANESDIRRIIRPVNFYITKARRIKEVAEIICKEYGGQVPSSLEKLMELPGVVEKPRTVSWFTGMASQLYLLTPMFTEYAIGLD